MDYKGLKKLYYSNQSDKKKFDNIVDLRKNNEVTIYVNLQMHPFSKKQQERVSNKYFDIFYVPNKEMQLLEEKIYSNSLLINHNLLDIPKVAINQLFMNNLIDELQSTNDIEGVHSSKSELSDTLDYVIKDKNSNKRFNGLVTQYLNFQKNKYNKIDNINDFRMIWDKLVKAEIDDANLPDGKKFRKETVHIEDEKSNKIVHVGDYNEEQITNDLNMLVKEMNDESLPYLPKCFIAHFFYEYVHPFYDGNGRTGRFIICSYLSRKLDPFSAITFSSAIAENKNKYYRAFSEMEDEKNYGEATLFIMSMMNLLILGQEKIIANINEDKKQFDRAKEIIKQLNIGNRVTSKNIILVLFQKHIFGTYLPPLTDKSLAKILQITRYKLNKSINYLEKKELLEIVKKSPKAHKLSKNLINKL